MNDNDKPKTRNQQIVEEMNAKYAPDQTPEDIIRTAILKNTEETRQSQQRRSLEVTPANDTALGTYQVWHVTNPFAYQFPDHFEHVGTVQADDLEQARMLTPDGMRSTIQGDVIVDLQDVPYRVEAEGFTEIPLAERPDWKTEAEFQQEVRLMADAEALAHEAVWNASGRAESAIPDLSDRDDGLGH